MGAAVKALGSLRSMRTGGESPVTSRTTPAAVERMGNRSPTIDCSGTLIDPSLGVSVLATITPLRTRVMCPGSMMSVSLLMETSRALLAFVVTVTREVSFAIAPASGLLTETSSPPVVSTLRLRELSTETWAIAEPISTLPPEALSLVGSKSDTLPVGSSATKVCSPAIPT
jgi:hypothetical protein